MADQGGYSPARDEEADAKQRPGCGARCLRKLLTAEAGSLTLLPLDLLLLAALILYLLAATVIVMEVSH